MATDQALNPIAHVSLGTRDVPTALAFYNTVLAELGMSQLITLDGFGAGYGISEPVFWIVAPLNEQPAAPGNGVHVALSANNRRCVDRFHARAVANGGASLGKPGVRTEYGENYYAAFVSDPDGNKLEAVSVS